MTSYRRAAKYWTLNDIDSDAVEAINDLLIEWKGVNGNHKVMDSQIIAKDFIATLEAFVKKHNLDNVPDSHPKNIPCYAILPEDHPSYKYMLDDRKVEDKLQEDKKARFDLLGEW